MKPILAAVFALALPLAAPAQEARTIIVTGTGEASAPPDMATLNLGVRAEAASTAEALDETSLATRAILDSLSRAGLAPADIRTGTVRLTPIYSEGSFSGRRQISGYRATNSLQVTVRDLDGLGAVMSSVVGEGANELNGLQFGIDDPAALMDAARRDAVADAAAKAALFAEAAGVELGDLIRLEEAGAGGYYPLDAPMAEARLASAPQYDVPVAAGEITVSANVTLVYAIAD